MISFKKIVASAGAVLLLILSVTPFHFAAAYSSDCPDTSIPLEVPLGPISCVSGLGEYLDRVYQLSLSIVGIIATVMIMIGGVIWITAGGNQAKVSQAKDYISSALIGMFILVAAYTILNLVNPRLTVVGVNVAKVAPPGQ